MMFTTIIKMNIDKLEEDNDYVRNIKNKIKKDITQHVLDDRPILVKYKKDGAEKIKELRPIKMKINY